MEDLVMLYRLCTIVRTEVFPATGVPRRHEFYGVRPGYLAVVGEQGSHLACAIAEEVDDDVALAHVRKFRETRGDGKDPINRFSLRIGDGNHNRFRLTVPNDNILFITSSGCTLGIPADARAVETFEMS
jgi:hypothetical protein